MKRLISAILLASFLVLIVGCAGVRTPSHAGSDAQAIALLNLCLQAHGTVALQKLNDVNVHYEGEFDSVVARLQPVLVDKRFRGISDERYLIALPQSVQVYHGIGGTKVVYRDPRAVRVFHNNHQDTDPDVRDAAALVADAYRLFLIGPQFFTERHATVQTLEPDCVDGMKCDSLLAILSPGIGNDSLDRVVLSIDQKQHLLRRVRFTLEGLSTTHGAVVDVFLRDPITIAGVTWPTTFYEELKRPFDLSVHHWRLTAIDFNRGPLDAELFLSGH